MDSTQRLISVVVLMSLSLIQQQLYMNLLIKHLKNMEYIIRRLYIPRDIDVIENYPRTQEVAIIKKFIKKIKFHNSSFVTITPKNKELSRTDSFIKVCIL
jgi:hypothetical protein